MTKDMTSGTPVPHQGGEASFPNLDWLKDVKTILLLGSGALKIGEAGEFDYSGSQAIKAFKEEGKRVVLINPNIATNQTSWGLADRVYFLPVKPEFVEKVIEAEKPEAIALSFGGQTALNCGVALEDSGVLKKYGVRVLGTSVDAIKKTEDRALFNAELNSIGVSVPRSVACESLETAKQAVTTIGLPVMIRAAFALGGKGSGRASTMEKAEEILKVAFVESHQVLVEEDLTGWKEIEYEVVRDAFDNCITVCNMENIDPLGIHTGESIVVAPSQTLDNEDYQMLRTIALKVIRHLGIIGECNIQYALHPKSRTYRVIEVNARLSRSSALASKATGYPLAFVAAKLALGYALPEIKNSITQVTCADFEPSLDYVAVKVPRWDLAKFNFVSTEISTEMKSVGEVMALGRTMEEALQKAMRMLNNGSQGLFPVPFKFVKKNLKNDIKTPCPRRIYAVAEGLCGDFSVEEINIMTGIDKWFLERIKRCADLKHELFQTKSTALTPELLRHCKERGFSDKGIAMIRDEKQEEVTSARLTFGITPFVKQIDTLAGEFPAKTNYMFFTYNGAEADVVFDIHDEEGSGEKVADRDIVTTRDPLPATRQRVIVIGGGPYSIGSSVEFDWCCVQAVRELMKQGYEVTMINSNPETVSTDYDECDQLFFDELTLERMMDVIRLLKPVGVVVSMGGQIPNSLALKLAKEGVPILGTDPANIDKAEDRHKFGKLMDELKVDQPEWREFADLASAKNFAKTAGYPVIVRPSYVLSGAAMTVVMNEDDLKEFIEEATSLSKEAPVVISKFETNAKEIDFDGVAQNGKLLLYAISEHVENAGVHSGDATIVLPPQRVNIETFRKIKAIAKKIAQGLQISGPFNIQFLAKNNRLKVIECNLRASRSFPFASKVTGVNFAELATQALLKRAPENVRYQTMDLDHVGVKAAQFSFSRLKGADPRLGVEMASTGEVACFGHSMEQALMLSLKAIGFVTPRKNVLLTIGKLEDKIDLLPAIEALKNLGFAFFATGRTHEFLASRNIPSALLHKISEPRSPNIKEYLESKRIDLVINIPQHSSSAEKTDGYFIRRIATDRGIPLITNVQLAKRIVEALELEKECDDSPLIPWPDLLVHKS
ncbi:MAG: carbamoyl-phosphate synthase (glutamine-hydrolyzing) large subunit [Candidatus Peribacteraceae bacterium]|nr:carbamoyl-phosphate synthase (glutamine-hydrolyzing) large subunit [Candidatus Peribacteraceae bacterium]MBP9850070.1 carbamoyl-phosphate synthase (glutamine-hydrolyzing) large subunit [Candidatus Peribacteraceae bacterium]